MSAAIETSRGFGRRGLVLSVLALLGMAGTLLVASPARAADPAVKFMENVAREMLAASRAKSPELVAGVVHRYADVGYIGNYALGSYRGQLSPADRQSYLNGMVRFIGRYTANEAPKYPIAKYEILSSMQGGAGLMVDSRITLKDGTTYDVRWLLAKYGSSYRVRDAMVYGFWMTPFMKKLFENHIAENGGNVKSLVTALNR
ncbi:MAG: ABC transporter substrate-binding protein [Hyphomicrobiaceae bacterium]